MLKSLDLIGAIELAYDRSHDEGTWLAEVTRTIAPAYSSNGSPVTSYVFDLRSEHAVDLGTAVMEGDDHPYKREAYERAHEIGGQRVPIARVYDCDPYTLLSRVVGDAFAQEALRGSGMTGEDVVGLRANATPASGVLFAAHVAARHRLSRRDVWTRFAAHLGTALRLRRSAQEASPDTAPAVLLPNGRLEHGSAEAVASASALSGAAKAIDRARGKMRRLDPEAAAELWRTMVRGEWSLVDWYDHDGKRFLLAQENRIKGPTKRALTRREEQVVACAAMGHSNKLIAYDLGLSTGTVSVLLGRAARKLGVSGRVALVRVFREIYRA